MKGIVFTEFLDMVETRWSAGFADALLDATELKSGGAYTTVGTYDFGEMVALLGELSGAPASRPANCCTCSASIFLPA